MLIDFREADSPELVEADLCVIGAGAAGITIANAYANAASHVCIIESGGLEPDADTQNLYAGELLGQDYYPLDVTRLRFFGGSTNHWSGWCAPLDEQDFVARDWIRDSGWPISRADLEPYYLQAQAICELGPFRYLASEWADSYDTLPPFDERKLVPRLWQFSPPTKFGQKYRDAISEADNVQVLLHANVMELVTNGSAATVQAARIQSLGGKSGVVRAKRFVLACGGLENPRILLLSNREHGGLGNQHALVGRYFMEHIDLTLGEFAEFDASSIHRLERNEAHDGTQLSVAFCPSPELQAERRILNSASYVRFDRSTNTGFDAALSIAARLKRAKLPSDFDDKIVRVIKDFDSLVGIAYSEARGQDYTWRKRPIERVTLSITCEQAPNRSSAVRLIDDVDALGLNRIGLDWQLSDIDIRSMRTAARLVAEELSRVRLCCVKLDEWLLDDSSGWPDQRQGGHHHMGTTRMAANPRNGVVDGDCRVHGLDNLYIAGSSVFPSGGFANPTLTIVALTLRLVDHLKRLG